MYNIPFPISTLRTRVRQEFEKHRFVNKLSVVDVLLMQNNAEYQEMMNYWKQSTHVMGYFNEENFRGADRLPDSFMKGFLEGRN
ncbi:ndufa6 NADH-ubiquinone oxidoreductase subunit [Diatrype stigma]|uniref:Ndufa6 NADH-ubiquinone oxidoreductase subunit n=1 Tax=Diatrype stigma TaxID=117547 RepID=A0AAN9UV70_9PEZI